MNTSAHSTSRLRTSGALGDFKSRQIPRLLRLAKCQGYASLACGCGGILCPTLQVSPEGGSTLITSAPKSDKITAALGPAMKLARSTTLSPEKMLSFGIFVSLVLKFERDRNGAVIVVQFFQCLGNPAEQAGLDLASVDLVQHFVSTARIEIESDVAQPGIAVAANQCVESPQLLPNGVFASGEQIDRQIAADLAKCGRIVQLRRGAEEGNKRVGLQVFKAERISHERIDDRL